MDISIIKKIGLLTFFLSTYANGVPLKLAEGSLLRDSEIESALETFMEPALKKIGNKKDISLHLVFSDVVNAFATGDRSIYLTTGIIKDSQSLEELLAVLLHELGHIEGHHIITQIENLKRSSYAGLAPLLLGLLAAGLTGNFEALGMGMSLRDLWAQSAFTGFSRGQESMADQFALKMLASLGWPIKGFSNFMSRMAKKQHALLQHMPLYLQTHPASTDRLRAAHHYVQREEEKTAKLPDHFQSIFDAIKIKIIAFSSPLKQALHQVNQSAVSEHMKHYGRAVVCYRLGKADEALAHLARFSDAPSDVFVQELKSQILFEAKRLKEALVAANLALKKRPWDPLLCSNKAQILIELNNDKDRPEAIRTLERALFASKTDPQLWYWLGVAYGREKNMGRMRVCFCEQALAMRDLEKAEFHLNNALKLLRPHDRYYHRAQEIASEIEHIKKNQGS